VTMNYSIAAIFWMYALLREHLVNSLKAKDIIMNGTSSTRKTGRTSSTSPRPSWEFELDEGRLKAQVLLPR